MDLVNCNFEILNPLQFTKSITISLPSGLGWFSTSKGLLSRGHHRAKIAYGAYLAPTGLVKVTRFQKDFAQLLREVIPKSITSLYHGGTLFLDFLGFSHFAHWRSHQKSRKNHHAEILQLRFQRYQKIAIRSTETGVTGRRRRKI